MGVRSSEKEGRGEEHREKAGERKSQAEHKMRGEILLKRGNMCVRVCTPGVQRQGVHGMCKLRSVHRCPPAATSLHVEARSVYRPVHLRTCNRHVCHGVHSACVDPDAGARVLGSVPSPCTCVWVPGRTCLRLCVCMCVRAAVCTRARAPPVRKWLVVCVCVRGPARDARSGLGLVGGGGGGAAQSGSALGLRVRVVAELGSGDSRARSWERAEPQSPAASSPSIPLSPPSPGLASATASRGTVAEGERPERAWRRGAPGRRGARRAQLGIR